MTDPLRRTSARGFSLPELLIVTMLMGIVMAGLLTLQDAMLRDKAKILRDIVIRNQADYARRTVIRELSQATWLRSPDIGTYSNELVGFQNLDHTNLRYCTSASACSVLPLNSAVNWNDMQGNGNALGVTWFRFCYDPTTKQMYYYTQAMNSGAFKPGLACMPAAGTCGKPDAPAAASTCGVYAVGAAIPYTDLLAGTPQGVITVETLDKALNPDASWTAWQNGVFRRTRNNTVEFGFAVQMQSSASTINTGKISSEVLTSVTIGTPNQ